MLVVNLRGQLLSKDEQIDRESFDCQKLDSENQRLRQPLTKRTSIVKTSTKRTFTMTTLTL